MKETGEVGTRSLGTPCTSGFYPPGRDEVSQPHLWESVLSRAHRSTVLLSPPTVCMPTPTPRFPGTRVRTFERVEPRGVRGPLPTGGVIGVVGRRFRLMINVVCRPLDQLSGK